jgi:hypothetical protein
LRTIAAPFVVAPPSGTRVRTRLAVSDTDALVLWQLGAYLSSLAGADLAKRCGEGRLDAGGQASSRQRRKQQLTKRSSSRWAGAITRTSDDAWALAERNLKAEQVSLRARIKKIARRLAVPAGARAGTARGYASRAERWQKQRRLQVLQAHLDEVESRLAEGRVSVCRGGRRLAVARHNLDAAGITEEEWLERWRAERLFITADGEADKNFGNETIRWNPTEGWLEIRLPSALAHLASRPHGRYRLSVRVSFPYRGEDVAAQAESGAVRYDISFDPDRRRWYLDASWRQATYAPALQILRQGRVLAIDVNHGHLACAVVSPDGNPVGVPFTIPLDLAGLPTSGRDGRLRAAISQTIRAAKAARCVAVVIEDLSFNEARTLGREHSGGRPSKGRRGRSWRRLVSGIPTARFRQRAAQMAYNAGMAVIAVDPAYTSRWGAEHWLGALQQQFSVDVSGHHAAALVIGRRGLGQRARRRARCDSTPPEDGRQRATGSAMRPTPTMVGLTQTRDRNSVDREAQGRSQQDKTRPANRASPPIQATQHRSGPPTGVGPPLLRV